MTNFYRSFFFNTYSLFNGEINLFYKTTVLPKLLYNKHAIYRNLLLTAKIYMYASVCAVYLHFCFSWTASIYVLFPAIITK